jgi:competence protein ComFB
MEIHNLMEDEVHQIVNEICDEEEAAGSPNNYCTSRLCRLDTVCYVLNRLKPRYVTSARGMAHVETDISENPQTLIDAVTLAHEALRRVSFVQRSYYREAEAAPPQELIEGPHFNFPTIKGRLFHGQTFEPMSGTEVELRHDGALVEMFDPRWQNPFPLSASTYGNYLFWPRSIPCSNGAVETFDFLISSQSGGFEPIEHVFSLRMVADSRRAEVFRFDREHVISDLYLFPI